MTKKEFKKLYAEYNNIKDFETASNEVEIFLETMKKAFSIYPKIVFRKFGTFEVRQTKARDVVDPRNKENIIRTKPKKYVKLKISKKLEEKLK